MILNILNQLHQHLRISIRDKRHALGLKFRLQVGIVLDDTVMDNGQVLGRGIMRVGIPGGRFTVGSPAGMGNTNGTTGILVVTILHKIINLALRFIDIQFTIVIQQRHAGTVITTILQSPQSLYQNRKSLLISDISNNSAHTLIFLFVFILSAKVHIFPEPKTNRPVNLY